MEKKGRSFFFFERPAAAANDDRKKKKREIAAGFPIKPLARVRASPALAGFIPSPWPPRARRPRLESLVSVGFARVESVGQSARRGHPRKKKQRQRGHLFRRTSRRRKKETLLFFSSSSSIPKQPLSLTLSHAFSGPSSPRSRKSASNAGLRDRSRRISPRITRSSPRN